MAVEVCGTCADWRRTDPHPAAGECWSADRLDGDRTNGPAGYHFAYRTCEAWRAKTPEQPA